MVARTVLKYAKAGVAALHIEDQVQTKRCGHLFGKQVVSRQDFLVRIRAAVLARDSIPGGSDFVNTVVLLCLLQTHEQRSRLLLRGQILPRYLGWKRRSFASSWQRMLELMLASLKEYARKSCWSQLLLPWPPSQLVKLHYTLSRLT